MRISRCENRNLAKACEVLPVERQQMSDAVPHHRSDKASAVGLLARDFVRGNEILPGIENASIVVV